MRVIDLVRLSSEIELKEIGDNTLAKFSIVSNDRKGNGHFFKACAWNKTAINMSKFFKKGNQLFIDGVIENNNYTNKDGVKVYQDQVTVNSFKFVDQPSEKKNEQFNNEPNHGVKPPIKDKDKRDWDNGLNVTEDDLPF